MTDGRMRIRLDEWQRLLTVKWMDERKPRDRRLNEALLCIRVSRTEKSDGTPAAVR